MKAGRETNAECTIKEASQLSLLLLFFISSSSA
jgi:hypothetical protein